MPSALDATVGGAAANTYATLAEANIILGDRLNSDAWTGASGNDPKNTALLQATSILQGLKWKGQRAAETQRLAWPRTGVYDADGYLIADDVLPPGLKEAEAELALELLRSGSSDLFGYSGLEGFESLDVGEVALVPRHIVKSLPKAVKDYLRPYLAGMGGFAVERG